LRRAHIELARFGLASVRVAHDHCQIPGLLKDTRWDVQLDGLAANSLDLDRRKYIPIDMQFHLRAFAEVRAGYRQSEASAAGNNTSDSGLQACHPGTVDMQLFFISRDHVGDSEIFNLYFDSLCSHGVCDFSYNDRLLYAVTDLLHVQPPAGHT